MRRIIQNVLHAGALQLVLTAASLPFLLWWRMPFPLLSILGNLVHPLFLTTFLCLTSILFFTTLLSIPDAPIAWLLTTLTHYWNTLFTLPMPSCWIPLHWWHLIPAWSIALLALCFILLPHLFTRKKLVAALTLFVTTTTLYWQLPAHSSGITFLRKNDTCLVCIPHTDMVELVDFGYISSVRNKESVMTYDVMPHLLFTYGIEKHFIEKSLM